MKEPLKTTGEKQKIKHKLLFAFLPVSPQVADRRELSLSLTLFDTNAYRQTERQTDRDSPLEKGPGKKCDRIKICAQVIVRLRCNVRQHACMQLL